MTDVIHPLPGYITDAIRRSGGRILVLVEGPDDELLFTEWFGDRLAEVVFVSVSGKADVQTRLNDIDKSRPDIAACGIVDRDYASDAEVLASLETPGCRCFLLQRFSIENYVLEPAAVFGHVVCGVEKGLVKPYHLS